jgi:hypothetical protein
MASGHANRINRPNTWLHRPMLRREVLTCQPGAVHTWHLADGVGDAEIIWLSGLGGRHGPTSQLPLMTQSGHAHPYGMLPASSAQLVEVRYRFPG